MSILALWGDQRVLIGHKLASRASWGFILAGAARFEQLSLYRNVSDLMPCLASFAWSVEGFTLRISAAPLFP